MKNQYKIDVNKYFDTRYPYALFVKQPKMFSKWEHVASFKTTEEAAEVYLGLIDLPLHLGGNK